jgi:tryptophanyl-tRNA synthetase
MNQQKKVAVSGVQASGRPSLGNYLGAFKPFVAFQENYEANIFVADLHAITVRQDPAALSHNIYAIVAWYVACGLDPERTTIFLQSQVPAHPELGWILNTFTQMGELERMTQFKDKSARHKNNINAGLFTYPALMAADILLYQPEIVPVGEDQRQHLELTRNIAVRFNNIYGDIFTVPEGVYPKAAARVKDLQDPTKKMSKSDTGGGTIFLEDDLKSIEKKIKRAVTDTLENITYDVEKQPGISNLLEIYAAAAGLTLEAATAEFAGQSQYGALKTKVAEAVLAEVGPVQARFNELMRDKTELQNILRSGAQRAAAKAAPTLEAVYKAVGYPRF